MNRTANATLHRRGQGTLTDRWVASGTMERMVNLIMDELPAQRRNFTIIQDGMEYHAAEIENLAQQFKGAEIGVKRFESYRSLSNRNKSRPS